jgi:cell division septum initiation protein DivIVA
VASGEPVESAQRDSGGSPASPESGEPPERRPAANEIADVAFPVSVRGYERGAVDSYVSRVQHVVAELEATRSPEAAVKQALERVGDQTKRILEQVGETAEQITVAARQEAEDSTARARQEEENVVAAAEREAAEIVARSEADAEATLMQARKKAAEHLQSARTEAAAVREEAAERLRELQADTETIRRERGDLLDDLNELGRRVAEVASAADERFPPTEPFDEEDEGNLHAETADKEAAAMDGTTRETS